jgi:hypothetical protein
LIKREISKGTEKIKPFCPDGRDYAEIGNPSQ